MYLILFAGIVLLWWLQNVLFCKFWSKNLSVNLEFAESYIFEGDESVLREVVVNDKPLPIQAVDVRLAVNKNLKFVSDAKENSIISDQTYKRDIFSFTGRQQITRKLHFTGQKRGFYEFSEVDISGYSLFFKYAGSLTMPQSAGLFVYPSIVPVDRIRLICQDISGMIISQQKINPDPFEFYGIREYVRTDPMNHINWKASVRMGDLMVNQFDSTTNVNLQVLLELEDANIWKQDGLLEECIRIAASLCAKLVSKNMPVTLKSNAADYETGEMIDLYMPAGGGKIMELYQKMACIDTDRLLVSATGFVELVSKSFHDRMTCVFVSKNHSGEIVKSITALTGKNTNVLWIMPQYVYEEPFSVSLPGIKFVRWEVAV